MLKTISQRELRHHTDAIVRALGAGMSFLVTRNGLPVGELRPIRRRFADRDVLLEALRSVPLSDHRQFTEDVDRPLDQDAEPKA